MWHYLCPAKSTLHHPSMSFFSPRSECVNFETEIKNLSLRATGEFSQFTRIDIETKIVEGWCKVDLKRLFHFVLYEISKILYVRYLKIQTWWIYSDLEIMCRGPKYMEIWKSSI